MFNSVIKITRYAMILSVLSVGLIWTSGNVSGNAAFNACIGCDNSFTSCVDAANQLPYPLKIAAAQACYDTYRSCLTNSCFNEPPPGGGPPGGRGKTACDIACQSATLTCLTSGGNDCGAAHSACIGEC